ncbi:MAG: hypothetical protein H6828_03160 [Planctomycetes bacterium]|nr:hypothetical protein [Planctomycetota bacterium]
MNANSRFHRRAAARADRRGNLLLVSIIFVMVIASMGMVMLQMHQSSSRKQVQATDNKRALYIAEAGLAEAFVSLAQGKSGNIGSPEVPALYGDGVYWVEATELEGDEVALVSTGLCGTGRFAVSAVMERQLDPLASLGFFASTDVVVGQGAQIDGYMSQKGLLEEQLDAVLGLVTGGGARLCAGGDITVEGAQGNGVGLALVDQILGTGTAIYGDAHPGPSGVLSQDGNATITGSTTPLLEVPQLPGVEPPETEIVTPWRFGPGGGTIPAGKYTIGSGTIGEHGKLKLKGPMVMVIDHLRMESGASLQIDSSGGQVALFVQECLELMPGTTFESTDQDPTGFVLFANGTEWVDRDGDSVPDPPLTFAPTGDFYGYVYAPGSDVTIPSDLHFIGGLAANSLTVAPGARLTFDSSLSNTEITVASLPKLIAWRIVELPDAEIVDLRKDPITTLKLNGVSPIKSSEAPLDSLFKIRYYDASGTICGYSGVYGDFDWTAVETVIGMAWDDGEVYVSPAPLVGSRVKIATTDRSTK